MSRIKPDASLAIEHMKLLGLENAVRQWVATSGATEGTHLLKRYRDHLAAFEAVKARLADLDDARKRVARPRRKAKP